MTPPRRLEDKVVAVTGAGRGIGRAIALLCAREGAKMGIEGLSNSLALDKQKFGVHSSCVAPLAWSRLITTIPASTPEEERRIERMKTISADKIAPLVANLLSDAASDVSGQVFGARKNEIFVFSRPRLVKTMHRVRAGPFRA